MFRRGLLNKGRAHLHLLRDGSVYTAEEATAARTTRHPAVLLLALDQNSIAISSGKKALIGRAFLVRPQVERRIKAAGMFSAIQIEPTHHEFKRFVTHRVAKPIEALPFDIFEHLIPSLLRSRGENAAEQDVQNVFDQVLEVLDVMVPASRPVDVRISKVLKHLTDQPLPAYSFDEVLDMAAMSSGRFSHLFTSEIGLSLRSFRMWQKIKEAMRMLATGVNLTEIAYASGFSDSAHLSRSFHATLGLIPSAFVAGRCVQVCDHERVKRMMGDKPSAGR